MTLPTLALSLTLLSQTAEVSSEAPSRGSGIVLTSVGGGAIAVGAICLIASLPLWFDGFDVFGGAPGMSANDKADIAMAGVLSTIGIAAVVTGAVLLPMGIKRLIASSSSARRDVELLPMFAFNGRAGLGGVTVRF